VRGLFAFIGKKFPNVNPLTAVCDKVGLVSGIQRNSIMWTRFEFIQLGFVAVVAITGLYMLSTLF